MKRPTLRAPWIRSNVPPRVRGPQCLTRRRRSSDAKRFDASMVGALHSRVAPDTDEDYVGALAEAGWSEKEIMVVLDDKA